MDKQVRFSLLVVLMASVACSQLCAQRTAQPFHPTAINGFVRDAITHAPLQYVLVTLESQSLGHSGQTETDGVGKFNFQGIGPGVFVVSVRPRGYQDKSQRIDLTVASTDYVAFELQPNREEPAPRSLPPEGPSAGVNARDALVPESARKEFLTARQLLLQGKVPEGSVQHLLKAIDLYHPYYDAHVLLGMAYIESGKSKEARSALEKAAELDPKLPDAHVALGMLLNHEKDYAAAEKSLTRGVELNPDDAGAQYELAKTYWSMGRWQDAEPPALKAETAHPDLPPVHVLLGNIQLRKRNVEGAVREFNEYLRLDPNGPMVEQTRAIVNKLGQRAAAPK
jgi:Flp pilus assembly protein TadD